MAEPRFRAADPAVLRQTVLDLLTLIYHRSSGVTHVVAAPVPEILAALAAPSTLAELLASLTADYDLADPSPAALAERVAELESAGLVERL